MESVLNELSVENMAADSQEARNHVDKFIELCKKLNTEFGFNKLRLPNEQFFQVELAPSYSLNDWLIDDSVSRDRKTLLLGLSAFPFFGDLSLALEDQFGFSEFVLNEPEHPAHEMKVDGLADAYIRNTLAVSFCSHNVWLKCRISLKMRTENDPGIEEKEIEIIHSSCCENCLGEEFQDWLKKRNRPPLNSNADVDIWFPVTEYDLTEKAKKDLIYLYQNNFHKLIDEIEDLIEEIWDDPMSGTGKPETLKGDLAGWMSRRITLKHRLVYKLDSNILRLYRCYEHYDDK